MFRFIIILFMTLFITACATDTPNKNHFFNHQISETASSRNVAIDDTQLAMDFIHKQDYALAKAKLIAALRQHSTSAMTHAIFGYYYQRIDDFNKANRQYHQAISLAPHNSTILNAYGVFLCNTKHYRRSLHYFRRAMSINSNLHMARTAENAGICALKIPDRSLAIYYLKQSLEANPKNIQIQQRLDDLETKTSL